MRQNIQAAGEPRAWAAVVFPLFADDYPPTTVFGAVDGSKRLHLSAAEARADAEEMCRKRAVSRKARLLGKPSPTG